MKPTRVLIFSLFIILSAFGLNACNRSDGVEAAREPDARYDHHSVLTQDDKEFVLYASEMHVGEANMAKDAKQKSANKDVLAYADAVIRNHSDALKQLSGTFGNDVVSRNGSEDTQRHIEFLSSLRGAEFDRQFMDLMIADHQDAAKTFQAYANKTSNGDLKGEILDVSPTLENLLKQARDVRAKTN